VPQHTIVMDYGDTRLMVQLDEKLSAWYLSRAETEAERLKWLRDKLAVTHESGRIASTIGQPEVEYQLLLTLQSIIQRRADCPQAGGVWSIIQAKQYIDTNFSQSFSVDFFVDKCAMNASDFSRRFKQLAACPLFEYINRQRVRRACILLKTSKASILEIADQVGYNNLSFFNRYFLRIMGCSPRDYRNKQ